jgi:hypothetical protein
MKAQGGKLHSHRYFQQETLSSGNPFLVGHYGNDGWRILGSLEE